MFEKLKQAFREAVDNFKDELDRDRIPENVDQLVAAMYEEVTDAKSYVRRLEEDIQKALRAAEAEKKEVATCRRRQGMAEKIGDEETARVAGEFAEKHEKRQQVLEQKALAMKEEMEVRKAEVEEMLRQLQEARERRDSLAATAGRTQARSSIDEAGDLFDQLDRMAEEIGDQERRDRAARDLEGDMDLDEFDAELAGDGPLPQDDVEERLRELKRRMGRDD